MDEIGPVGGGKTMQPMDVPVLEGDRAFYRELLRETFSDEVLTKIEADDPGRSEHYMEVMDFILSAAYSLTQPEGDFRVSVSDTLREEMSLDELELQLLLGGMERSGLIALDEGGIRIGRRALEMIPPPPKERLDG